MTNNNRLFSTSLAEDEEIIVAVERVRLRHKLFRLVTYKLENGETAVTTRQMAISVKKPLYLAKGFIRKRKIQVVKVQMLNRSITDMVYLSTVLEFWKSLNSSHKGNALTVIGQQYLHEYLQ